MQPSTVGDGTRRPLSTEALEGILEAVELLSSLYPLEDELVVPEALVNRVRELVDAGSPARDELEDQLVIRLRLALDDEHTVEVEIAFPLRTDPANVIDLKPVETQQEDEQLPQRTPPPIVHLLQPAWLQNAAFERLESELGTNASSTTDDEPTTIVLDYVQRLLDAAPAFLPAASLASTRSSFDGPAIETAAIDLGELSLIDAMSKELLICVSKMHHIRSMSKFKKLKGFALDHGVSGLAKAGRPGLMLYEIEGKESLARFLEAVRGLKYLEFHHLASAPLDTPSASSISSPGQTKSVSTAPVERLVDGAAGLREVDDTKDLILAAERIGRKEWLRSALGMTGKGS